MSYLLRLLLLQCVLIFAMGGSSVPSIESVRARAGHALAFQAQFFNERSSSHSRYSSDPYSANIRYKSHRHRHLQLKAAAESNEPWSIVNASKEIYTGATASLIPNQLTREELPLEFDWCDTPNHRSFCTASWNQHIPTYCGSCYIHGALHAANDRLKLLLDGKHDMMLARQVILNCGPAYGLGSACDGGEVYDVFEFMKRYGLPDETCHNYLAKPFRKENQPHPSEKNKQYHNHHDKHHTHPHDKSSSSSVVDGMSNDGAICEAIDVCMNCMPSIKNESNFHCWEVDPPIRYYVTSYGLVTGELAMMNEIFARGPITCAFATVDDFDYNYRGGVYVDAANSTESNHDVEVVGWGVDSTTNTPYWKARNSWGENSFFKIIRGVNNMRFEEECVFALFEVDELMAVLEGLHRGSMFGIVKNQSKRELNAAQGAQQPLSAHPDDSMSSRMKATMEVKKSSSTGTIPDNQQTHLPPLTTPIGMSRKQYYKAKYATPFNHRNEHHDQSSDSVLDGVDGDVEVFPTSSANEHAEALDFRKDNMNINLNLNLNFKRRRASPSQMSSQPGLPN